MKITENYMEKVYAGWLGKIIGIRLGAPIEGWTYQRIRDVFGEVWSYPADYKNFAADDDSNGPLFFIRALEDCEDSNNFSSKDVANALLNYAPYEHGFFWWGGYGVSTEHTAYLNLRNGIPAPRSGSIEQNGATMAEQIGGQIFIDSWGLVSPGNPEQAAKLAEQAASVTHGGNGVYGGIYVACCISLAFVEKSIRDILEKALQYIPSDCEYARVVKAVMKFHDEHPENWRDCFNYIFENFGYDKYPGTCHIIPNAAVMILSMLYGHEDFSDTINICNMCGWDTDCNVGNVGTIMGVFAGIDGIDYDKWVKPINDFLACSNVLPSLNAVDIPFGASYFAKMAYVLAGEEIPENWNTILNERMDSCHFEYPTSTHAIRSYSPGDCYIRNTDEQAYTGKRSLKLTAVTSSGEKVKGDGEWHALSLEIPGGQTGHISEVGVILCGVAKGFAMGDVAAYIDDLYFDGKPDYRLDFGRMKLDSWHVTHQEVPQFAKLKGHSYLDGQYLSLSCADFAEMYTGHHLWNNYRVTAVLKPVTSTEHFVNIRVQGAMRSYAAGFSKNNKLVLRKNYYGYITLCETDFEWKVDEEYKISLTADGSTISVSVNDKEYLKFTDSDLPLLTGCAGISVEKGSHCLYRDIAITGRE